MRALAAFHEMAENPACNESDAPMSDIVDDGPDDLYDGLFDPYDDLAGLTGADPVLDLEDADVPAAVPPRSPILTGLVVGLLLVALSLATVRLASGNSSTAVADTTTSTSAEDVSQEPTDSSTTTTLSGGATDGSTTTTTPAADAPFVAVGTPIPVGDLTLQANGIGPIKFGTPAVDAFGILISSLGAPDSDTGPTASIGGLGVCVGETERVLQWGSFKAVAQGEGSNAKFVGYRLDLTFQGSSDAAGSDLRTLSGLQLSDRVSDLDSIYGTSFDLQKVVDESTGGTVFRLFSKSSGDLLLWGPLTSTAPEGIVRGIYSPDSCPT